MSRREIAEHLDIAQGTLSDIERGRIRVNAADLLRFAAALGKSALYFLPGVATSDLSDTEQTLVALFREFDEPWQTNILGTVRNQLILYKQTKALEAMPEADKEEAAYDLVLLFLSMPTYFLSRRRAEIRDRTYEMVYLVGRFLEMNGLKFGRDEQGRPYFDTTN